MDKTLLEHINIVFIGHVDAGKSTTCGQILCLTGMVDTRTLEKYQKEANEHGQADCSAAYVTDVDEEERERNITIDIGRAYFSTTKKRYTILDAPGHKMYVPNMINGVSQADVAILLIPARKGEFESGFEKNGQTKEHALLARSLGVKKLVVAINKMDDQTVNWDQNRFDNIKTSVGKYLRDTGFQLKDITFIPISGFTGMNIKESVPKEICPWNTSQPLLEILDSMLPFERLNEKPLRIPVLDKIREEGKMMILGKIETGILKLGDEIVCHPNNIKMQVYQIMNNDLNLEIAKPGENLKIYVKMNFSEEEYISKGNMITHSKNQCTVTSDFVAKIYIRELTENVKIFSEGAQCVIHLGLITEEIKISKLLEKIDNRGKIIEKLPKFVLQNSFVIAHITFSKAQCIEKFDDFERLGLFVLRNEGKTIGLGKIISTNAPKLVKRTK